MGKRSNFARRPHDAYDTPFSAVLPLVPHIEDTETFAEPFFGNGYMVRHLERLGLRCTLKSDIKTGTDALTIKRLPRGTQKTISNPPWTRELLHPLITHLSSMAPAWLLFDSDWANNQKSAPFLRQCRKIVVVGRVKWIEESRYTAKDNASWYLFDAAYNGRPQFINDRV